MKGRSKQVESFPRVNAGELCCCLEVPDGVTSVTTSNICGTINDSGSSFRRRSTVGERHVVISATFEGSNLVMSLVIPAYSAFSHPSDKQQDAKEGRTSSRRNIKPRVIVPGQALAGPLQSPKLISGNALYPLVSTSRGLSLVRMESFSDEECSVLDHLGSSPALDSVRNISIDLNAISTREIGRPGPLTSMYEVSTPDHLFWFVTDSSMLYAVCDADRTKACLNLRDLVEEDLLKDELQLIALAGGPNGVAEDGPGLTCGFRELMGLCSLAITQDREMLTVKLLVNDVGVSAMRVVLINLPVDATLPTEQIELSKCLTHFVQVVTPPSLSYAMLGVTTSGVCVAKKHKLLFSLCKPFGETVNILCANMQTGGKCLLDTMVGSKRDMLSNSCQLVYNERYDLLVVLSGCIIILDIHSVIDRINPQMLRSQSSGSIVVPQLSPSFSSSGTPSPERRRPSQPSMVLLPSFNQDATNTSIGARASSPSRLAAVLGASVQREKTVEDTRGMIIHRSLSSQDMEGRTDRMEGDRVNDRSRRTDINESDIGQTGKTGNSSRGMISARDSTGRGMWMEKGCDVFCRNSKNSVIDLSALSSSSNTSQGAAAFGRIKDKSNFIGAGGGTGRIGSSNIALSRPHKSVSCSSSSYLATSISSSSSLSYSSQDDSMLTGSHRDRGSRAKRSHGHGSRINHTHHHTHGSSRSPHHGVGHTNHTKHKSPNTKHRQEETTRGGLRGSAAHHHNGERSTSRSRSTSEAPIPSHLDVMRSEASSMAGLVKAGNKGAMGSKNTNSTMYSSGMESLNSREILHGRYNDAAKPLRGLRFVDTCEETSPFTLNEMRHNRSHSPDTFSPPSILRTSDTSPTSPTSHTSPNSKSSFGHAVSFSPGSPSHLKRGNFAGASSASYTDIGEASGEQRSGFRGSSRGKKNHPNKGAQNSTIESNNTNTNMTTKKKTETNNRSKSKANTTPDTTRKEGWRQTSGEREEAGTTGDRCYIDDDGVPQVAVSVTASLCPSRDGSRTRSMNTSPLAMVQRDKPLFQRARGRAMEAVNAFSRGYHRFIVDELCDSPSVPLVLVLTVARSLIAAQAGDAPQWLSVMATNTDVLTRGLKAQLHYQKSADVALTDTHGHLPFDVLVTDVFSFCADMKFVDKFRAMAAEFVIRRRDCLSFARKGLFALAGERQTSATPMSTACSILSRACVIFIECVDVVTKSTLRD